MALLLGLLKFPAFKHTFSCCAVVVIVLCVYVWCWRVNTDWYSCYSSKILGQQPRGKHAHTNFSQTRVPIHKTLYYNCAPRGMFLHLDLLSNIDFNMLPLDSFMSNLYSQLGFFTGEFQALQLVVLAVFGIVNSPLAPGMLIHFLEI